MLPGTWAAVLAAAVPTTLQTTFLTAASGSNQTYHVPSNFVSNVSVEVASNGGGGFDESTDGCGNGRGDFGSGGSGGYAIKAGVTMVAGGTVTYGLSVSGAVYFAGASLAASSVGILNGTGAGGNNQQQPGASTTGAKGDTVVGGNNANGFSNIAPPSQVATAASGSGLTNPGYGQHGTDAGAPGQGFIKIINLVAA